MKKVIVSDNYEKMSRKAAELIFQVIEENPEAVIVLATGHSPLFAYRYLVEMIREKGADISGVTFVKLDEWEGLSTDNEATCEYFLQKEIIGPLLVRKEKYLHFEAGCDDPEAECRRVEREFGALPQADLVILGIGMNGHLGLNEPGDFLTGPVHRIKLNAKTKTHELLTHTEKAVEAGVTLGMENLFSGKRILLLADGKDKETGLSWYLNDRISTQSPVSLLKLHPGCVCLVNRESFPAMQL